MPTETPEPTLTPTPTETPTATPTFTPTPDFFVVVQLDDDNQYARFERSFTAGDSLISLLLFVLVLSIWGLHILRELRGDKP